MNEKERYADYQSQFDALREKYHWDRVKPNPNGWLIVKKWNQKYIYDPSKKELFDIIENALNKEIELEIERTHNFMD